MSEQIRTIWIYLNIVLRRGLWISCKNVILANIISFYKATFVHQ